MVRPVQLVGLVRFLKPCFLLLFYEIDVTSMTLLNNQVFSKILKPFQRNTYMFFQIYDDT